MAFPLTISRERLLPIVLLALWAILFLPHLRTNPNWYGDEGFWMDSSWTLVHGHPSNGALKLDFLFPYPYPPLYLALNGAMLRVFGNDILWARLLQALTALAAAMILFWIGTRLRDRWFGLLCAAAFLAYPETVINFRWVRGHPMAGTLALAAVGFLIRYVQENRWRDIAWAGVFCSLATASSYWTYGLIVAVVATAVFCNPRHLLVAAGTSVAFLAGYFLIYVMVYPDGLVRLLTHLQLLMFMSSLEGKPAPTWVGELLRMAWGILRFCFATPTTFTNGMKGLDLWLIVAALGVCCVPARRFRKWIGLWLLALMVPVFKGTNNASTYLYRAMTFVPLMAVGCAAATDRLGILLAFVAPASRQKMARALPSVVLLGTLGCMSLAGSLGHFRTKIDGLTVSSASDAEAAAGFIQDHTATNDLVLVPSELYWLIQRPCKTQLADSLNYDGQLTGMWPVEIPRDIFRFDCRWQNAKYLVLAAGLDKSGKLWGVDAAFTMQAVTVQQALAAMKAGHWTNVMRNDNFTILANPKLSEKR